MRMRALRHGGFGAAFTLGLLFLLPAVGLAHSGGTDEKGCHAGSQPYHCHGGGGGGGGGAGLADLGPTPAERAEIAKAQAESAQAEASYAKSKPLASGLQERLESLEEELDQQRSSVQDLRDEVDRGRKEAASLRAARIAEREDAAERIEQLKTANHTAQEDFLVSRLATVYLATFFGGFLLFSIAKLVAVVISGPWRIATVLAGLFGSIVLIGLAVESGTFGLGIVPAAIGGLLLAFVFMLARTWWMVVTIPTAITVAFLGLAGLVAVAAIAVAATVAPPAAEEPTQEDQALVAEAQSDPAAEELEQAQEVDAGADEQQAQIDELTTELADIETRMEALAERTEAAKAKAEADAKAIASAQDKLDSLS